jgi:1,4-dihydroxy-6-naphthoate synthase
MSPMTRICVAHSPDSDDAFMFYALANGLLDTGELEFEHVLSDIESLNREAFKGTYEVTAVSIHAYTRLDDRYALLDSGASMGDGYGPVVVARRRLDRATLRAGTVAVPGELTSAALALKMWDPDLSTVVVPFDDIGPAVAEGRVDAGVLIHEGQLTWHGDGLESIVDLGVWWAEQTGGLPLPLGGNVVRRDLGPNTIDRVAVLLKESIVYALEHRSAALDHAMTYGRGLDRERADRFVDMYVNDLTVSYGRRGRQAVEVFLRRAHEAGLIPRLPRLDFVGAE